VVIDGTKESNHDTIQALAAIADPRLTAVSLPSPVGGAEARNVGMRMCRADFIAWLDDDDEWLPNKLSQQLEIVRKSAKRFPVVTSRVLARRPHGDEVWPTRMMKADESMSEYLLCREASIRHGEGFIQTSTLLVPRSLMLKLPFRSGLPRHQDWDWLIRASVHPGVEFHWVWEPLVVYHIDGDRPSVSGGRSLAASVDWVNGNSLVTPKARAYFYATQVAARCKTPATFWSIIRNTAQYPRALMIAMGLVLTPHTLVDLLRPRRALHHA
jgi:glycosyltransferase involved in cell wall biosynthesis